MDYIWINYGLYNYGYNVINILSMGDLQDPKMEVPTIYKAYVLGLCK